MSFAYISKVLPLLTINTSSLFFWKTIYLAAPGISLDLISYIKAAQDLLSLLRYERYLVVACGVQFPDKGPNPGPLHCDHGVLATGPSGRSQYPILLRVTCIQFVLSLRAKLNILKYYSKCTLWIKTVQVWFLFVFAKLEATVWFWFREVAMEIQEQFHQVKWAEMMTD